MDESERRRYMADFRLGMRLPSRYPCRCRRCGFRRTLRKQPEEYVRPPKCRRCKTAYRIDWYRMQMEWHKRPCRCDEYSFPHAKGRGFCMHNTAVSLDDREQRYEQRRYR